MLRREMFMLKNHVWQTGMLQCETVGDLCCLFRCCPHKSVQTGLVRDWCCVSPVAAFHCQAKCRVSLRTTSMLAQHVAPFWQAANIGNKFPMLARTHGKPRWRTLKNSLDRLHDKDVMPWQRPLHVTR